MATIESKVFNVRRSHDFPDVTKFPPSLLKEASDYYEKTARFKEKVSSYNMITDFSERFDMSPGNAQILVSAAKFRYAMKKKGLA